MWSNNRFVAMRDPRRGGLHIAAASSGLETSLQEEISDNCLELIAKDYNHPCTSVYVLSSGEYMVAMAKKVSGTKKEARTHEIIRGVVMEKDEVQPFCKRYMLHAEKMKELFFPENSDLDNPGEWILSARPSKMTDEDCKLVDQLDGGKALYLFNALQVIQRKQMKVQLLVKEGAELGILALLSCISEIAGTKLFFLASGECTLRSPDVLILDTPIYQDMRRYRKMTWEQFIYLGRDMLDDEGVLEDCIDPDQESIDELVEYCLDYITERDISDYDIYEEIDSMNETRPYLYQRFLRKLRKELFHFEDSEYYTKRYMKLLYVAYKELDKEKGCKSVNLEMAPYDFSGMYQFLKKKAKSRRDLRRLLVLMLEVQFQCCAGEFNAQTVHKAACNLVIS